MSEVRGRRTKDGKKLGSRKAKVESRWAKRSFDDNCVDSRSPARSPILAWSISRHFPRARFPSATWERGKRTGIRELQSVGFEPVGDIGEAGLADADAVADQGDGDIGGLARLRGQVALGVVFELAERRGIG
jgi:hypothetical protein